MSVLDCIEEIEIKQIKRLFFVEDPIRLCRLEYPGHKNGCPSIGRNKKCPPYAKRLEKKYDLTKSCWFIYLKLNIQKQEKRMVKLHPTWSKKQARCLLYWQPTAKKELIKKCELYKYRISLGYELIPEAMGLHVFETAHNMGLSLERDYSKQKYIYKIAFLGELKCQH